MHEDPINHVFGQSIETVLHRSWINAWISEKNLIVEAVTIATFKRSKMGHMGHLVR